MGDEINYLKVEIDDVISEIQEKNPNTIIKLALLFYRDKGDEYVTRYFDFTQDIQKQKNNLSNQNANGGGDFEEAVYKALGEAVEKQWSSSSETRVLVHVADAPSHDNEVKEWNKNVLKLTKKGIKVISVASSGIDKKTEYFFRSQSMITGGCYVYLTLLDAHRRARLPAAHDADGPRRALLPSARPLLPLRLCDVARRLKAKAFG